MTKEVFVKLDSYNEVLGLLDAMKAKIERAKLTLGKVKELKHKEDTELQVWENNIAAVEEKINFIDGVLVEPKM